jgi:hypothetical protein
MKGRKSEPNKRKKEIDRERKIERENKRQNKIQRKRGITETLSRKEKE